MKLPDKVYDVLKWILVIFVPSTITLISSLGALLGFDATIINGVIGIIATFVGSLVGISTIAYNKEQKRKSNFENL